MEGLITTLVDHHGARAVNYLGALLYDYEGYWFPAEVLPSLIQRSKDFQNLFRTYGHVASFLKWNAFASDITARNMFPGPDDDRDVNLRGVILLGYGKVKPSMPLSRSHKADLIMGGLFSEAAIRLTWNINGAKKELDFGPVLNQKLSSPWPEGWVCKVPGEEDFPEMP